MRPSADTMTMNKRPIKLDPPKRGPALGRQKGEVAAKGCNGCNRLLTICSFSLKGRAPIRRQTRCRECMAVASRTFYVANREAVVARSAVSGTAARARNRAWLRNYLADKACTACGLADPSILEFDHRHAAKRDSVSRMIHNGLSIATIEVEIAKCDLLCPACHRLRTHIDTKSYLHRYMLGIALELPIYDAPPATRREMDRRKRERHRLRNQLDHIAFLEANPCVDCGEADLRLLECDHVIEGKSADVSRLITSGFSLESIAAERALCEVRCCNCHRRKSGNVRPTEELVAA